jgi:hypothetical protein
VIVNGSATATLTLAAGTDAGTYTGTVSYSGAIGYAPSSASATIVIVPAVPVITWPTPAAITYPTPLSSTQLDATASVPGKFVYSPAAGSVLNAGTQILSVTFTPANQVDYAITKAQVSLVVKKENSAIALYMNPPPYEAGLYQGVGIYVTDPSHTWVTGTVTVKASTGETCTKSVIGGSYAVCFIIFNTPGSVTITGSYSGDINNNPSVSAPITINVTPLGGGGGGGGG